MKRVMTRKMNKIVAGVDEAGRGPLAGPVVAAAVILTPRQEETLAEAGIDDSKALSPRKRETLFCLMSELGVVWRVRSANAARIDRMNILQATLWTMGRCIADLPPFDEAIIDGLFIVPGLPCLQRAVPKADTKIVSVMAASIVAKVNRDRTMCRLDTTFPGYRFAADKGYPTVEHRRALERLGPSPVHRKTFRWKRSLGPWGNLGRDALSEEVNLLYL
jgi:ribonuclease HII